jgi:hypothetical protein
MTSRQRRRAWRGAAALSPLMLGLPLAARAQQAPGTGIGGRRACSSNVEASILEASYPEELFAGTPGAFAPAGAFGLRNRQLVSSHLNLIWSPVPAVDLGIEGIYERRTTEGGQRGSLERGQVSAKFRF